MARERSKNREESQAMEPSQRSPMSAWQEPWPSTGPFSMMRRFADQMDRMFDRVFEGFGGPSMERGGMWGAVEGFSPGVDIVERDGKLLISADLPGLNKDDVKVDVTDDAIIIEGERKHEYEHRGEGVYRMERGYGRFRRHIPLPEGAKPETATATFKNGVLQVAVESPEIRASRRRIEIQGEGTERKPGQSAA
jgi:HSP20 family protein